MRRNDGRAGCAVEHSMLSRWVIEYVPEVEKVFRHAVTVERARCGQDFARPF